ncbi:hypothetical protein [Pontibacter beigongshangensis]|uniref:hypothetical protein n=1 Tax=Pontibacter beigongshangensis TaxID=2574733 RepID=UPI00164F7844|nr:hypothetical protein [Pontibacter beigongshangensis]
MVKPKTILILGSLVAMVACERPAAPTSASAAASYNLTAYLEQQTARLQKEQPMVLKSVTTQKQQTETIETTNLDWTDELAIFRDVDLSRPALREFYTETSTELPNGHTQVLYTKSETSAAPVQYLQLHLSPSQKLQRLEALVLDENILFYSRRKVVLTTDPQENGNISSYRIEGTQKLIFSDSLHYNIIANL